jgi:hypothetical protein
MTSVLSAEDHAQLARLEESMWIEATRFNEAFMQNALAPDFFEFGKSGKMYTRDAVLGTARRAIDITLPLRDFGIRLLDEKTAQSTYISETGSGADRLLARRSSIWSKTPQGWQLRFHQGTPIRP